MHQDLFPRVHEFINVVEGGDALSSASKKLIIAIDGPAAAGKSSAGRGLARQLGYLYLDSGSLYRAMAWKVFNEKVDPKGQPEVEALCEPLRIDLRMEGDLTEIWVDGVNSTPSLRQPEITRIASLISPYPGVRRKLLSIQRSVGKEGGVVVEGRDIGTVVFPEAAVKFYLDAAIPVRGARRHKELQARGITTDLQSTTREIEERDLKDSRREVAPLKKAADAVVIDSTLLDLDKVIGKMVAEVETRGGIAPPRPAAGA